MRWEKCYVTYKGCIAADVRAQEQAAQLAEVFEPKNQIQESNGQHFWDCV